MLLAGPPQRIDEDEFPIHALVVVAVGRRSELQDQALLPHEMGFEGFPRRRPYMVRFVHEKMRNM